MNPSAKGNRCKNTKILKTNNKTIKLWKCDSREFLDLIKLSSENLKFYKDDRAWLLAIFEEYGTGAVVDLEFTSANLSFSVVLDFDTVSYDEIYFECGYKFSRLADQIKELDEVGKIEVEPSERAEYQLNTRVQV